MHKHRNTGGTTFFYQPFKTVTEIRSGYLYKSPPKRLTAEKSWKRRYFVLFKVSDQEHYLKYFKSEADRETLHKEIDLSQISLMYGSPEHHQKWDLIQRTMKCSPSCVLYIRTPNRDYFFVGADSDEVDGWFTDLFEALKNRPHTCMSSEEMRNQEQIAKNISKPNMQKKNSDTEREKQQKSQSLCDLYPYEWGATGQAKDFSKRPASEPVNPVYDYPRSYLNQADVGQQAKDLYQRHTSEPMNPVYDYPRSYLNQAQICENSSTYDQNEESVYVTMVGLIHDNHVAQEASCEAEEVTSDSLVTSTIQVFSKLTARVSPLPQFDEETDSEGRKETPTSDHSSSPPGNYSAIPPVEILESTNMHSVKNQSSTESLDPITPEERDIKVKQADLKKHLTVTEVDGKPIVSGWTGQPQTVCLFHKGDRILAINDLHVSSVDEFNMYLSRSLKNEVKLTILRLPGCPHLHFSNTNCTDC